MTCNVRDLSEENLKQKIENIKAECEKKVAALKRYEEELERRKQEVPLGVPLDKALANQFRAYALGFASEDSACVFDVRIKDYVEALQKLAKGEPIDVKALSPLLKKGYVAMDKNGNWRWYAYKPLKEINFWKPQGNVVEVFELFSFNLKPAENWEDSLMECGL